MNEDIDGEKGIKEKEERHITQKASKNIDLNSNGYIGRERKRMEPSPM